MNVHHVQVRFDATKARAEAAAFDQSMGRLDQKAGGLGLTFNKLAGFASGIGLGLLVKDMASTIIETEKMKGSLQTMTGSMDNANKAFDALNQFAATTPFTLDQSVNAFVKMKSLGLEPTAAALTSFGNTASAMGKDLNMMIEAVADASTGEFERLKEFGIKAKSEGDNVSLTFQGVTTTIGKNAAEITGYLQKIGEEKFGDAMRLQMERLPGQLSNLRDNVQNLWRALGDEGVTSAMARVVGSVSSGIASITNMIKSGFAAERVKALMDPFVAPFVEAFSTIGKAWKSASDAMGVDWGLAFGFIPYFFADLVDWIALIPKAWQAAVTTMLEVGGAMFENWGDEFAALSTTAEIAWKNVAYTAGVAWDLIRIAFSKMQDWVLEGFSSLLLDLGNMVAALPFSEGITAHINTAAFALKGLASSEKEVQAEMAGTKAAHDAEIAVLEKGRGVLYQNMQTRLNVATENSAAAWREVAAEKDLIDERQAQSEALLDNVDKGEDWQKTLDELAKGTGENTKATGLNVKELKEAEKARDSLTKKLQPYLDKINGVSEAERTEIEVIGLVDEAMRLGIIHTSEEATRVIEEMTGATEDNTDAREDLTQKLQPYLDKIQGVTAAERTEMEVIALVDEAMRLGIIHTVDEATQLIDELTASMGENKDEAMTWETALKRSVERLDDVFGNMWQDFMQEGSLSFKGLADGFKSMVGEINHGMITQPIMLQMKNMVDGEKVDWEGVGNAALSGIGVMGGTLLGGGGKGASLGAGIGSIAGMYFGPVGSMIGGMLGGLVGGMFDSDPQLKVSGGTNMGKYGARTHYDTGLGGFNITKGSGGVDDIRDKTIETLKKMDDSIADFLSDGDLEAVTTALAAWSIELKKGSVTVEKIAGSRLDTILGALGDDVETFVKVADSFEDRMTRLVMALQAKEVMAEHPELFGDAVLGDLLTAVDLLAVRGKTAAQAMDEIVNAMMAVQVALNVLDTYATTSLETDYAGMVEAKGRTLAEALAIRGAELRAALDEYDGTASSVQAVADAVLARYELELAMLTQLDAVAAAVTARFDALRTTIDDYINPKTYEDHQGTLDGLFAELGTAVDPEEIDRITKEIERVARLAWGGLTDDMKATMGQRFIEMLDEADRLAHERLDLIKDKVLAESALLRDEVGVLMEGITDPFHLVINDLGLAADLLILAGERQLGLEPGGGETYEPGEGIGGKDFRNLPASEAALNNAAATLATEGAATRASQDAMAANIAAAIASIPGRIVVQVTQAATASRASNYA